MTRIAIALRGLRFGAKFEDNAGEGCMVSMQPNVNSGYQLSVCSTPDGRPW
jgi:hypothetical protein